MSHPRLLILLTGTVLVLVTIVAVELWTGSGGGIEAAAVAAPIRDAAAGPSATTLSEISKDAPKLTTRILARPLFAINRRPDEKARAESSEPVVSNLPRLAGIATIMNVKFAVFQPHDGSRPIVVGVGDTIAGRKIQAIAVDEIVLTGPEGAEHIHPMPDPALEHVSRPTPGRPISNVSRPPQQRRILTP